MTKRNKKGGWYKHPDEHALASRGIKTKHRNISNIPRGRGMLDLNKYPPEMVGDGNFPNMYWVTVDNIYYVIDEEDEHRMVSITEIDPDFEYEGDTIAVFDTYKDAVEFAENRFEDRKEIEDRLSGVIYESYKYEYPTVKEEWSYHEDVGFTKKKMNEAGYEIK